MIHAYDELYLENSKRKLGIILEEAVLTYHFNLVDFYGLFLSSGIADAFGKGDTRFLSGMSGHEILYNVFERMDIPYEIYEQNGSIGKSPFYWAGSVTAHYQWQRNMSYRELDSLVPIDEILEMYHPFHEMDISSFIKEIDKKILNRRPDTVLSIKRKALGISQSELSLLSGIPVRTIQQYEQRQKNINMARAEYLVKLAAVFSCSVEELLEKITIENAI